jgi:hypothetical protein
MGNAGVVSLAVMVCVVLAANVLAADEVAGWVVNHTDKTEMMEVGEIEGHVVGVSQHYGISSFTKGSASGEIASRIGTVMFDSVKGKSTVIGYAIQTFQDGSTLAYKTIGTATTITVDGIKKLVFEGAYEYTGMTGRFEGLKGKGTYKG